MNGSLITLSSLLIKEWYSFKHTFVSRIIDRSLFTAANIILVSYILPSFGVSSGLSLCMIGSLLSSTAIFEVQPFIAQFIHDLEGPRKITYELMLPMPSWFVMLRHIIAFAIKTFIYMACMIPIMKLFLGNTFDLWAVNWPHFVIMLCAVSAFCANFAVVLTSITPNLHNFGSIWTRFIYPLWFFGGFQFSWSALKDGIGTWAYINLINPVMYANEGFRAALFPGHDFIPVLYCAPILFAFSIAMGVVGIRIFKQRLDFI